MIGFPAFFAAVHGAGRDPYPWQCRLAERCATAAPPAVIAVPTGCGKTATIDALVWALAGQAERPAVQRTVGVRLVWAIDRRILVDEVHDHATRLAAILGEAIEDPGHPLATVARRLALIGGGGRPLVATRWRGGLDEPAEMHGALQPQIITTTIAQIGSRMLFRGYGVGRRSLALAAGLSVVDSTICLDEAHLVEPFRQTVAAIGAARSQKLSLPPLGLLTVTATPSPSTGDDVVRLEQDDREALADRLAAPKTAVLVTPENDRDADRAALLARTSLEHVAAGADTVACVVNTVQRARAVFAILQRAKPDEVDVALLVGPQRPADRREILAKHRAVLLDGRSPEQPLVLVATQTFEVGLDADVAAMVTESASAAALVQRFGRLNRAATPGLEGRATVVRDAGRWLYEDDEPLAWQWLTSRANSDGEIDVSVAAIDADVDRPPPQRISWAPALTTNIIELLVQTSPRPSSWADPDIDVFLRGVDSREAADVAVCWRADLDVGRHGSAAEAYRTALVRLVPPHPQELLSLSVSAARGLIAARYSDGDSTAAAAKLAFADADVEGEAPVLAQPHRVAPVDSVAVPFLVIRAGEVLPGTFSRNVPDTVAPRTLRPGDIVVLPTAAGGCDDHGLNPRADRAVDRGRDLDPEESSPPVPLRLTRGALAQAGLASSWDGVAERCRAAERRLRQGSSPRADVLRELISSLREVLTDHPTFSLLEGTRFGAIMLRAAGGSAEADADVLADLDGDQRPDDSRPVKGISEGWVLLPAATARKEELDRDERGGPPPTLHDHANAVRADLEAVLARVGLPEAAEESLLLAARAHDHGKGDPRVQAFYNGGRVPFGTPFLAKSGFGTRDPKTDTIARRLSGLPDHLRHEIGSVAVLAGAVLAGDVRPADPDLALHLVGVHHGYGRPVPPIPSGGASAQGFLVEAAGLAGRAVGDGDDGWDEGEWLRRFWRVMARHGPWGTAYLEALLMLSDRTVSASGA